MTDATRHRSAVTRRDFMRLGAAALLTACAPFYYTSRLWAKPAEPLPPGALAPEAWGPAGWYEAIIAYIDTDEIPATPGFPQQFKAFRGQVILLREPWQRTTYVYLAGYSGTEVVKGYRVMFPVGIDQPRWSESELNISLGGGGGGAQLRYDRELGDLTLWLDGFVIGAPEVTARRFGSNAAVAVDRGDQTSKSRILHQSLGTSDQVQFYMRAGTKRAGESLAHFLMAAHLSLREPLRLPVPVPGRLPLPAPFPMVTRQAERLIVTQWSQAAQAFTSFVWTGNAAPILDAPTSVEWARVTTAAPFVSYVPRALHVQIGDVVTTVEADTSGAGDLGFTAEAPSPDGVLHPRLTLATLPVPDGFLMTQATAVTETFLPLVSHAYR